ncbi:MULTISPECIES: extensin family protein [Sphingomonas]|uniref:extensin-like domain-containing protein n=1 Tax=Sphingomonas TaxID=13687 RepID=UPI000DEF5769|nr:MULTISPECIES: extensin family protein [Sphingomonas]
MLRALRWFLVLTVIGIGIIEGKAAYDRRPQDFPWTAFDLDQPTGRFTAAKIAALGEEPRQCRALLAAAGVRDRAAPARRAGPTCGFADGMFILPGGARDSRLSPAGIVTSCPIASALLLWDRRTLQPAAAKLLGSPVAAILHAGSYNCRRINGAEAGAWSEHATADAIDVLGFRLADGRTVSIARDWRGSGREARFLHEVRDGGCGLFTTVLSPDYNAAHRDHLHLDTADRGPVGWNACR